MGRDLGGGMGERGYIIVNFFLFFCDFLSVFSLEWSDEYLMVRG